MENTPRESEFASLGLDDRLVDALSALGYEEPTPIQRESIPALIAGRDLLGQAATGTGKTAAFALPIVQRLVTIGADRPRTPSALVLVPTRELAMQVAEAIHRYGSTGGVSVLPIYGGQAMQQQLRALKRGVDVVVATPGRVLDHIRRSSVDFSRVGFVVLDEADEMLDMGFADDLEAILTALPTERQTALFSATIAPRIATIAKRHLKDPLRITIAREKHAEGTAAKVREVAYVVARKQKVDALGRVLDMESPTSAIVFCRTRTEVDELTQVLGARGYGAEALHGGMSQEARDRVMRRFRDGTTEILIATDVAARGLDIEHLSHVVNFDIPWSSEAYVHRIGRTGRAGREGVAITLLESKETRLLRNIEQATKRKVSVERVPTLHDVRARRLEMTSAALREMLEAGDVSEYRVVVESLSADYDLVDIAAAAVKLAHDVTTPADESTEPEEIEPPPPPFEKRGDRRPPTERKERKDRKDRKAAPTGDFIRLFVPMGKKGGIRPGDLVGAIANEVGVDPQEIGAIDIADNFSLVEVREADADRILDALRQTTIRGKRLKVRRERY